MSIPLSLRRCRYPLLSLAAFTCIVVMIGTQGRSTAFAQDAAQANSENEQAASDPPQATEQTIRKLVKELDAKSLKERDEAEKRLIELGPNILGSLPVVDANTSGEMKVRLQRIRQQLQSSNIETFFEASKVTLSGKMKLPEAVRAISTQTGNKISLEGEGAFDSVEVDLDEKDVPFWTVMDKVMSQAKLRVNAFGAEDGLSLVAGGEGTEKESKAFNAGPFRINVASIQSSIQFNSRLGGQLDLSLTTSWEPRLKPVYLQIPMAKVEAITNGETTLTSASADSNPEVPLNGTGSSTQIDLQLQRPTREMTKLTKLSGEIVFAVPSERHKYVFKKFGNGARQVEKFGEVEITLEGARRNNAVYEIRVLAEIDNDEGVLESYRGWALSNEAYLLDPKGRRLENAGWQTYAVTSNAVGIAYLFQINGNPDDFQLVYESPASITSQSVKFELQDIELP